jgi:DNA/RNA endonuclease G (NUC1)
VAATFGACNGSETPPPPPPGNSIAFSGRLAGDPPLPVGFQDQLFATLRDGSGTTVPTTFIWLSETPALASIDEDGVITALAAGTATFRATAADGTTGLVSLPTRVATPGGTAQYAGNAEFGEPQDGDASDDFLVRRDQYTASFNHTRGTPNWVSYNLDASHFGAEDRCDCFTFDPELPGHFTRYTTADYTGAGAFHGYGIDRGHLARSFDRTTGSLDNATTFYFSNIIPQAADQNQGPWSALEIHVGDLARLQNREVYIIAGVAGSKGTVKNEGVITIPASTWKVAVILPRDQGLAHVDSPEDVELIAVIMPNDPGVRNVPWQTYETTVDAVEALSGYDLLALLPDQIEIALESETAAPVAATDGPYAGTDGNPVNMSAAASSDPDGDALTYAWEFGDGSVGSGVTVSHIYVLEGTYTVRLTTTDTRGLTATTATTATITAAPAAQRIERAIGLVQQLVASGRLGSGPGRALQAQLEAALGFVERGRPEQAAGVLGAVLNTIDALVRGGRLSEVDAAVLQNLVARVAQSVER